MKSSLALWLSLLAGPAAWMFAFLAKVFIGGWVCVYPWKPALFAITAVALALTAGAGWIAWSHHERGRTLAMAGMVLNAGFALVVLAQTLPELMLGGCE